MKKILSVILILMLCIVVKEIPAEAAKYKVIMIEEMEYDSLNESSMIISGYNVTHGFTKLLDGHFTTDWYDNEAYIYVNYVLPDDGSTWEVDGSIFIYNRSHSGGVNNSRYGHFHETVTTPGTFTGVSIGQAVSAANNAKKSADSAKSSADSAKSEATAAKNNSATAANRAWDSAEGKSAPPCPRRPGTRRTQRPEIQPIYVDRSNIKVSQY